MPRQACLALTTSYLGIDDYPFAYTKAAHVAAYFDYLSGAVAA
jgi:hypothetical protein